MDECYYCGYQTPKDTHPFVGTVKLLQNQLRTERLETSRAEDSLRQKVAEQRQQLKKARKQQETILKLQNELKQEQALRKKREAFLKEQVNVHKEMIQKVKLHYSSQLADADTKQSTSRSIIDYLRQQNRDLLSEIDNLNRVNQELMLGQSALLSRLVNANEKNE